MIIILLKHPLGENKYQDNYNSYLLVDIEYYPDVFISSKQFKLYQNVDRLV